MVLLLQRKSLGLDAGGWLSLKLEPYGCVSAFTFAHF